MPMLRRAVTDMRSMSLAKADPSTAPIGGQFLERQGGLVYLGGDRPAGMPIVDVNSAMALTAFYRGVRLIAASIAAMPLETFDETEDADGVIKRTHVKLERDAYLWRRPNPEQTRITFWETAIAHEVVQGNCYIYVINNGLGLPGELWLIAPARVKVGRASNGDKVYLVDEKYPLLDYSNGGEIIHVPGMGYNGLVGFNVIRVAETALGLGLATQNFTASAMTEGSIPPGVLTSDQVLTVRQADQIRTRWESQHEGLTKRQKIAVLGAGAHFQSIQMSPADTELLLQRRFQVNEIARLLGVPPHLLADVEKSTSWGTGIEEMSRGFVQFTLFDHMTRFEQSISDGLLGGTTRYAHWNAKTLMRANYLTRMQAYAVAISARVYSPNDARFMEDMEPYEGGDEFLAPSNMMAVDDIVDPDVAVPEPKPSKQKNNSADGDTTDDSTTD